MNLFCNRFDPSSVHSINLAYVFVEFLKKIHSSFPARSKYFHRPDSYFHTVCTVCYILHAQWLILRIILLSGDVELNPGPETLDFCCWNLNSITAYDV